jgi:hypothetical protein
MGRTEEVTSARTLTMRCPVGLWLTRRRTEEAAPAEPPATEVDSWARTPRMRVEFPVIHVEEPEGRPRVVAEILSDGTVQVLDRAGETRTGKAWSSGTIAGERWTIWWERRRWSDG